MGRTRASVQRRARSSTRCRLPTRSSARTTARPTNKRMTGVSQDTLEKNWAKGGRLTCCNGFTGWFGAQLGATKYMGVFDLNLLAETNGTPSAWVVSTASNWPRYGDIRRDASFHVDICLGFDGNFPLRAAGGQGGPIAQHDLIKSSGWTAMSHTTGRSWSDRSILKNTLLNPLTEVGARRFAGQRR